MNNQKIRAGNKSIYLLIFIYTFSLFITHIKAQENPFYISVQPQYGQILKHSSRLNYLQQTRPYGFEITTSWHLINDSIFSLYGVNPKVGAYVSIFNLKHQTLGYVLPTGIYFEPFFRSDKKLSFKLKAGAGIAYISNPYDSIHNPQNWAYSMKIIGHAFLGLGVNFRLSNHLSSGFSTQLHHFSNGGIKEPNKGLNIPAIAIDFSYCINPIAESKSKINKQPYRKKTWYELGVFDALQSDNQYKRLHVYGTWISFSKQISRINALSVGSEIIINTYNRTYIKKSTTPETDHKRMNCLLGHEFRMGKVVFSQSIGIYIYSPYQAKEVLYQRYGLSYYFRNKLFTGVNLKAHRHVGDFIDFRIGYSIPK